MQKAIGHTNAPHPELEAELQQEYAKIVPKVERGIVTKAEADHLHSLEARAHGHTERGGLTAIAQSVAARRERQASISSSSSTMRSRANSRSFTPHKQSHHDLDVTTLKTESERSRIKADSAAYHEADPVRSRDQRSPEKGGASAAAQSSATTRRYQSLSDSTNTARASVEDLRKQSSINAKLAGLSVYDEESDNSKYSAAFPRLQAYGSGDKNSSGLENMPRVHTRENSQPAI